MLSSLLMWFTEVKSIEKLVFTHDTNGFYEQRIKYALDSKKAILIVCKKYVKSFENLNIV